LPGAARTAPPPPDPPAVDLVEVISTSHGGGAVDRRPVELAPEDHLAELVAGLEAGMPAQVRRAVAGAERDPEVRRALAEGHRLMGAVVWVGCETPREVTVTGQGAALEVRAVVPDKGTDGGTVQCLVPVTTVALFLV
jgi:hypothetical protein